VTPAAPNVPEVAPEAARPMGLSRAGALEQAEEQSNILYRALLDTIIIDIKYLSILIGRCMAVDREFE